MSPRSLLGPYGRLFTVPGAVWFSLAGWVARLPLPMLGLGAVLLVEGESGSYALAGAVAGTLALSAAVGVVSRRRYSSPAVGFDVRPLTVTAKSPPRLAP